LTVLAAPAATARARRAGHAVEARARRPPRAPRSRPRAAGSRRPTARCRPRPPLRGRGRRIAPRTRAARSAPRPTRAARLGAPRPGRPRPAAPGPRASRGAGAARPDHAAQPQTADALLAADEPGDRLASRGEASRVLGVRVAHGVAERPRWLAADADGRGLPQERAVVRLLQSLDVDLLHLEHRFHDPLRLPWIGMAQHLAQDGRIDLP
jgi:hypothetical protein